MKIETSLDWDSVSDTLTDQMIKIGYNPDLTKMYYNIRVMVNELGNLEVTARRTRKPYITQTKLDEINQAIDHLEKLLLIAKLMQ